jgi:lipopolysaccharide/colanic/teichoic acid biosynthesis glycosyltransferase
LDLIASCIGLLLLSPLFLLIALGIKLDSKGPVFFRQQRMGKNFKPFWIYKFRTMVENAPKLGAQLTSGNDPRITRLGRLLRKTKLDELPQLLNVLKGEMSLVGPRPEVARYVKMFKDDYAEILKVPPGITDLASVKYQDEAKKLGRVPKPEKEYIQKILPEKIRLAKRYLAKTSLAYDISILAKTALALVR